MTSIDFTLLGGVTLFGYTRIPHRVRSYHLVLINISTYKYRWTKSPLKSTFFVFMVTVMSRASFVQRLTPYSDFISAALHRKAVSSVIYVFGTIKFRS